MSVEARSFLFLQGPPGPFFAQLARRLETEGHQCHRVNFNGGDRLSWPAPAVDFRGTIGDWPARFEGLVRSRQITDIVLYGDCRPLHRVACRMAGPLGARIHVFEEGYIRPDWVTLERDGVNGFSTLPRHPAVYLRLAETVPPLPDHPPIPSSFRLRAREALVYFVGTWLLAVRYPGFRSHRPYSAAAELGGWMRKLLCRPIARRRAARAFARLGSRPYFMLPLQLDSDHQIRTHSPFAGMADAIATIVASFAAHAPGDCVLLVKEHPLDNGIHNWRRTIERLARSFGIADRILYVAHGDLYSMIAAATGVVTVNSTTGTLALAHGTPVAVLGNAVYDLPGVTHQGTLDQFWTEPGKPQVEIYDAYRRVLAATCLLRGGFSSRDGRAHLLPAAAARLCAGQAWTGTLDVEPYARAEA
ncbi:capsular biosynthesis protein [Sphingomonas sp. H39-1-10]|uniref:capsule biosynthesis protein n=1 Tax=Sphingomonas pollutisoli TaxID=3030829 RepID=UPI0023B968D1|nr:capsular biosynthesis protein [Sphingomonas pollutisoli]MDF0490482.1 capsular biosynthesis protein [Sphingomonas pollutisoli]